MALAIPVTWSHAHRLHAPEAAVWVAVPIEADDVLTASVHVDPAEGWFPHFLGFADETRPANLNVPLLAGSGDDPWLEGADRLVRATLDGLDETR